VQSLVSAITDPELPTIAVRGMLKAVNFLVRRGEPYIRPSAASTRSGVTLEQEARER